MATTRSTGGPGADVFDAGAGDDVVDSRDGLPETVDCGAGTGDFATVDLVDRVATISITGTNLRLPTCESVSRLATDDGPTGPDRRCGGAGRRGRRDGPAHVPARGEG